MIEIMADRIRYNRCARWLLIRLHSRLPRRWNDRLLDFLYPDDMTVTF